jgi:DNA repair protein RAD5
LRVVLDEAHVIRTRDTRNYEAVMALKAPRRWCLTGTPMQNQLDDLYSLVHFVGLQPLGDYKTWTDYIVKPFKNEREKVLDRIQVFGGLSVVYLLFLHLVAVLLL